MDLFGLSSDSIIHFSGSKSLERLVNHPVHVNKEKLPSALIPYCAVGEFIGKKMSEFDVRVCDMFQEKVVNGQVCYEAEVNALRKHGDWKLAVERGLVLIVDPSDEYDVKNLLKKDTLPRVDNKKIKFTDPYRKFEDDESIRILLKSISWNFNSEEFSLSRCLQTPCPQSSRVRGTSSSPPSRRSA